MRAKKLFPELTFKRLWNKITGVENKVDKEVSEINKKLNENIIVMGATLTDGATIQANDIVSYPEPTLDGYTLVTLTASCTGANNTNVVPMWLQDSKIIVFRNLTNSQITTGKLSYRAMFLKI